LTEVEVFHVVSAGFWILQIAVPAGFFGVSRWPRSLVTRGAVTIISVWVMTVIYVDEVYNPAGVAFGIAEGMNSPLTKYDNNKVASTLFGGWIYPMSSVVAILIIRVAGHKSVVRSK